jgi:hypothetical protein
MTKTLLITLLVFASSIFISTSTRGQDSQETTPPEVTKPNDTNETIARLQGLIKDFEDNPAAKSSADRQALLAAIRELNKKLESNRPKTVVQSDRPQTDPSKAVTNNSDTDANQKVSTRIESSNPTVAPPATSETTVRQAGHVESERPMEGSVKTSDTETSESSPSEQVTLESLAERVVRLEAELAVAKGKLEEADKKLEWLYGLWQKEGVFPR